MFAYKQTLMTADQKEYIISACRMAGTFIRYVAQMVLLITTRNYTLTIAINIAINILSNYLISAYVERKYKEVFLVKGMLSKAERSEILRDTKACLCHKVGGVVLSSTDNLILSKSMGLVSVGLYSNYTLIISNLTKLANQLLSNMTASLGNAHAALDEKGRLRIYNNLIFLNLWIASTLTICIYVLINPFIRVWVGEGMMFGNLTVICICLQFFLEMTRQVNMSFTSASGLFVKDVYRPFIEAGLNLVVSILFVYLIGTPGVFLGTIVSCLCTVTWREPYLLFKYDFKCSAKHYITMYCSFLLVTVLACGLMSWCVAKYISITTYGIWAVSGVAVTVGSQLLLLLFFGKWVEFAYLKSVGLKFAEKLIRRRK